MRGLLATFVLGLALALAGCGEKDDRPVLTIEFAGVEQSGLGARVADMRRAAELAIENTGGDTAEHRLVLSSKYAKDPIARIVAPIPPEVVARTYWTGPLVAYLGTAPADPIADTVNLLPTEALSQRARRQYVASGLPSSRRVAIDRPEQAGEPAGTYVSPALTKDNYPPAGRRFFEWFEEEYGHEPDRYAIFAYEAVSLIVDAIQQVEESGRQITIETVKQQAFQIHDRFGPIGHYDVLANGNITQYVFQARGEPAPPPEAALIEVRR